MNIEYEATFPNIDKDEIRKKLAKAGAVLVKKEFLQKRVTFDLPKGHEIKGAWMRVRDEGDKVTMSFKIVDGDKISDQKEAQLIVDNFSVAEEILLSIGCPKRAYQETKREIWDLDNVEITIDEWPFLEPFVEVEGESEEKVKNVSQKIGFDYSQARFCSADTLYSEKYNIDTDFFNNEVPEIVFGSKNPFLI